MINLREQAIQEVRGWERLKLQLGFTDLPQYACRDLQDLLSHQTSMQPAALVVVPKVQYFPGPIQYPAPAAYVRDEFPVRLRDHSADVEAWVRPGMRNDNGRGLAEDLESVKPGEELAVVTFRNGYPVVGYLADYSKAEEQDRGRRLYFAGFWKPSISLPKKQYDLGRILQALMPDIDLGIKTPKPVRVPS